MECVPAAVLPTRQNSRHNVVIERTENGLNFERTERPHCNWRIRVLDPSRVIIKKRDMKRPIPKRTLCGAHNLASFCRKKGS